MAIPKEITKGHVISAIKRINAIGTVCLNPSTGYDLYFKGRFYRPKEVLRFASLEATGKEIPRLKGGDQTNNFLLRLGFDVVIKGTKEVIGLNHTRNKRNKNL